MIFATWPTHNEKVPPNSHQQPTIATSSNDLDATPVMVQAPEGV
jgi:hypothetical protein